MVNNYRVHDTQIFDDEVFMRSSTLTCGLKKQDVIGKAVEKRLLDSKIVNNQPPVTKNGINEIFSDMTLQELRSIDDDDHALSNFIHAKSSFLKESYLNVIFINLEVTAVDEILQRDYDALNNILTWGNNDLYVMPTISYEGVNDRSVQKDSYKDFVKKMLLTKNSITTGSLNVGMSIPSYFRHKDVEDLFGLYRCENKEPSFISVDFCRSGVDDTKRMGIANKIRSHYNDSQNENYFLYGLNVRTYKHSGDSSVSDEMMIAKRGFNAFGSPHYQASKRKIPPTTELRQLGRVFNRQDYHYHSISVPHILDDFVQWTELYGYDLDFKRPLENEAGKIRPTMKKYSAVKENEELCEVSTAIRKSDYDLLDDVKFKN